MSASDRAVGQLYGIPIAGKSAQTVLDGTDKTVALEGGRMCILTAVGGDAFYGAADQTVAGNKNVLLSGNSVAFTMHP